MALLSDQNAEFTFDHPLSNLHKITYVNKSHHTNENLFDLICSFLDIRSLTIISCCNKEFKFISSAETIWKPLCLSKWPELKMATNLDKDPFPIYKSCYKRKASQESTSMQDLMKIFGGCDWYSCPNGHLYAIGECRMAVMMSKCPECGEKIGGRFHRHLDTNYRIGAVNSSYKPFGGHGMKNEDEIQFDDVANAVHKSRRTVFGQNENENYNGLGTICEEEVSDFDRLKKQFEKLDECPEYLKCPLSLEVFIEPMVTPHGRIYERKYIEDWLKDHDSDPMDFTDKLYANELKVEKDVEKAARLWRSKYETNDDCDDID